MDANNQSNHPSRGRGAGKKIRGKNKVWRAKGNSVINAPTGSITKPMISKPIKKVLNPMKQGTDPASNKTQTAPGESNQPNFISLKKSNIKEENKEQAGQTQPTENKDIEISESKISKPSLSAISKPSVGSIIKPAVRGNSKIPSVSQPTAPTKPTLISTSGSISKPTLPISKSLKPKSPIKKPDSTENSAGKSKIDTPIIHSKLELKSDTIWEEFDFILVTKPTPPVTKSTAPISKPTPPLPKLNNPPSVVNLKPVSKTTAEPVLVTGSETITKPSLPVLKPTAPISKPKSPISKPVLAAKPAQVAAQTPVTKPVAKPISKPVSRPISKPVKPEEPVIDTPAAESVQESVQEPIQEPTQDPTHESTEVVNEEQEMKDADINVTEIKEVTENEQAPVVEEQKDDQQMDDQELVQAAQEEQNVVQEEQDVLQTEQNILQEEQQDTIQPEEIKENIGIYSVTFLNQFIFVKYIHFMLIKLK